ncbi:putative non-heme bromoperoxidase BpoC [Camellia lanceoleosa]|uniref:Non-heme bromoperoxidase BpoC n=1 Tax=Camellia lanceoleosa TaxID=1840588 RepID=A0ACC0J1X1_9ERIC|nr:putative non-heme bromoperoxidase BpoC [Camellia lanceoleosa]
MPFCYVGSYQTNGDSEANNNGTKIFYRTYGRGPIKVLMIIGFAGTHDSWHPQIKWLTGTVTPNDDQFMAVDLDAAEVGGDGNSEGRVEVCAFDNRGMGRSSVPTQKSAYTTRIMAKDAIALMDHLGWRKAHVFGHSMGAMISCKLAALVPDRVLSLALLNVTGGGYECFPKLDRQTLSIAIRFFKAKTPEQRAAVDLDIHYTKEYLEEYVGPNTRKAILYQEYVKGISTSGMQSNHGFEGQINACWNHKMSQTELELIRSAGFLISVIHGRDDIIAQLYHAKRLAEKLQPSARMIELHGGHLVSHERTEEVNQALSELINASEKQMIPYDWTNLPTKSSGWVATRISLGSTTTSEAGSNFSFMVEILEKLFLFLNIFGLFVLIFEFLQRGLRCLKPVAAGPTLT